jgi:hypothetical protein
MYYLVIWLIIASSALFYYLYQNEKVWRWSCALCYVALVLTAGLRYETGTDYFSYADLYSKTPTLSNFFPVNGSVEIGYLFLNSLFRTIGVDINLMFLLISAVTMLVLFRSFQKYIPRSFFFLSLLLYYSTIYIGLDMSGVRQSIALAIFIFSLQYVFQGKFWKYFLSITIALLFHQSAIFLLAFYPLFRIRIKSSIIIAVLGIGVVIFILKISWLHAILEYGASLFHEDSLIAQKLITYTSNEIFLRNRLLSPVMPYYVLIFIVATIKRKQLSEQIPYFNVIFNLFFLFVLSFFYLYESVDISLRFGYYFMVSYVLLFPLLLTLLNLRKRIVAAMIVICMLNLYAMRGMFLDNNEQMMMYRPYQNYITIKTGLQRSDAKERMLKLNPPKEKKHKKL